jgi:hypothetical protein
MTGHGRWTENGERRREEDGRDREKNTPRTSTGLSLSLREGDHLLFASRDRGLRPLLICAKLWPGPASGRVLADRITGIAAARVIVAAQLAGRVESGVITRKAIHYLKKWGIAAKGREVTETILCRDGTGPCPMERLSWGYQSDREFLSALYRSLSIKLPESIFRR